jgi:radical SAM superfamily enzyme YgiQ (UPF0313 family)
MKKIVFAAINCRWTHSNLALYYLKKSISDLPFLTEIIEFSINQSPWELIAEIYHSQPDFLAFSVYIWNVESVKKILAECEKIVPECQIILGGPEVSYQPEAWLAKFPNISNIICGAGEKSFREVILGKREEEIVYPQKTPFSQVPFPYSEEDWQFLKHKYVYYESSRGCPFQCSYCLSSRMDNHLDYKQLDVVLQELGEIISHEPKIIKFVDRTFNSNPERAREIWQFLAQKQVKCHFEIHPQLLAEADFAVLSQIPPSRFQFEIGIQTLNEETLQAIHRKQDWQKCKSNIQRLRKETHIHLHVDLILGLPFETSVTFQESFNEVYSLQADAFQLGFLKVLAGTEMREKETEYQLRYLSASPYQIMSTKWLNFAEVLFWQDLEKLVNLFYNSGNFTTTSYETGQLFSSPYAFYKELGDFWLEKNLSFEQKDWQHLAISLVAFIHEKFEGKSAYFLDCLRWDWCKKANSHFYPPFLHKTSFHELKKEVYPQLKDKYPANQLKKAIFLEIETSEFADKYANGKKKVFFSGGEAEFIQ